MKIYVTNEVEKTFTKVVKCEDMVVQRNISQA